MLTILDVLFAIHKWRLSDLDITAASNKFGAPRLQKQKEREMTRLLRFSSYEELIPELTQG
jgi:hypothetical protein